MASKLEIFKPGTFTDSQGKKHTFSESDVRATAAAYNPAIYSAPLVIGHHPKETDPAWGEVASLDYAEKLLAEPINVDPDFAENVNAGRYNRISSSFYPPDHARNPVPGVFYLRHVAFLGAVAPAIKGLKPANFSEDEEGVIEFAETADFGSYEDSLVVRTFRGIKNALIELLGQDKADKVIDEYTLETLQRDADARPGTCSSCGMPCSQCNCDTTKSTASTMSTMSNDYSEGATMTKEELEARERSLNEREKNLQTQENGKKHQSNIDFAEQLVADGKLLPTQKSAAIALLDFAEGVTTGDTIDFGEGDDKKSQAPAQALRDLLTTQPKRIDFGSYDFSERTDPKKEIKGQIPADIAKYV